MRDWLWGIAAWLSQGLNKIVLNGSPDMTVSARCYVNRNRPRWRTGYRLINRVFFWQANHCQSSFHSDVMFAVTVLAVHRGDTLSTDNPSVGQK